MPRHNTQVLSNYLTNTHYDQIYQYFLHAIQICEQRQIRRDMPNTRFLLAACCRELWGVPNILTIEYHAQNFFLNFYRYCDYRDAKRLCKEEILAFNSQELRNIAGKRAFEFFAAERLLVD